MKVLIVDENPADLLMQADLLALEGCSVVPVGSVVDAVRFITIDQPDLILADVMRLGMSGIGPGSILRALAVIYDIPMIAVTNDYVDLGSSDGVLGCAGVIGKPIDTRAFAAEVVRLCDSVGLAPAAGLS